MPRLRTLSLLMLALASGCSSPVPPAPSTLILWAWERPEDLRFVTPPAQVAVQGGFVELIGDQVVARGRRHPLRVDRPPSVTLVHIQIDEGTPLRWTPGLRRRTSAAVLHYATRIPAPIVQVDFEVRASQRQVLLDVLGDIRHALPPKIRLSMTALASWCDGEDWLDAAPVDEIVPMLFRMGRGDAILLDRLAKGGDFRHPRCRTALGIATDTPVRRAPPGRRVYLFDPRSWTRADFTAVRKEVEGWR